MLGPGPGDRLYGGAGSLTLPGQCPHPVPARQHPSPLGTRDFSWGQDPALVTGQCLLKMGFPYRNCGLQHQEAGSKCELICPR